MKITRSFIMGCVILMLFSPLALAVDVNSGNDSASLLMMELAEVIVYGESSTGGLAERLDSLERELFGRDCSGSISERHSAILNFLETGAPAHPSMLFRLGIIEWLLDKPVQARMGALQRVERLENNLDGTTQYGRPLATRVERLRYSLLPENLTSQKVFLPAGTVLWTRFLEEVRNATASAGDQVFLALDNDLLIDGVLIAPRGSLIDARVRSVRQPGRFGGRGRINIDFRSLLPLGPQRITVIESEVPGEILSGMSVGMSGTPLPFSNIFGRNIANIWQGDIALLETYHDMYVYGYMIPENLRTAQGAGE